LSNRGAIRLCASVPSTHAFCEKRKITTVFSEPRPATLPATVTSSERRCRAGAKKPGTGQFFLTGRQFESQDFAGHLMAISRGSECPPRASRHDITRMRRGTRDRGGTLKPPRYARAKWLLLASPQVSGQRVGPGTIKARPGRIPPQRSGPRSTAPSSAI